MTGFGMLKVNLIFVVAGVTVVLVKLADCSKAVISSAKTIQLRTIKLKIH